MIYAKPLGQITYQDVSDFCAGGVRASNHLEYRADVDRGLGRTIAAMANTWGGVIIVGVEAEEGRPKPPFAGVACDERLPERISDLVAREVSPPVFPEVQVCPAPEGGRALVVVRVPQSTQTPHAVGGSTQVYVRTNSGSEREELATVERVQWLVERRRRSEDLRSAFFAKAESRFDTLCRRNSISIPHTDGTLAAAPTYPFELLCRAKELQEAVNEIKVRALGGEPFPMLAGDVRFEALQNGVYGFKKNDVTGFVCYEEVNQYGFLYHREDFGHSGTLESGKEVHYANLSSLLARIDGFLESLDKLYQRLGYRGPVEVKIVLRKLALATVRDLPPPKGQVRKESYASRPVDEGLAWTESFASGELRERRVERLIGLFMEVAWGLGFSHISETTVRRLLEEGGRA